MSVFVVDNRLSLAKDSRLKTALKILQDTAILGRATSWNNLNNKWTHFGLMAIEENLKPLLHLQDLKRVSLFVFNKAFDQLVQMIDNNMTRSQIGHNKGRNNNVRCALEMCEKQFKELKLKGKKEKELMVVVIADSWEGKVEREIDEFCRSASDSPIIQINVVEINGCGKSINISNRINIHSLPIKGHDIFMEGVCKDWVKMRSMELKFTFPNKGPEVHAKVEDLLVDLRCSQKDADSEIPKNLTIIGIASMTNLCRSHVHGRCLLLSCSGKEFQNHHRWESLCKLARNNETVLIVQANNKPLYTCALIPCDDLRMMMQPIACVELLLPISDCQKSTSISEDFISTAKILPLSHEYGLGPQAKLIQYLKGEWVKNPPLPIQESTNTPQVNVPKKQKMSQSGVKKPLPNKLAHPALGMYSK